MRPLLVEETARRRRAESRLVDVLERASYDEVLLPIIDYAEPYAPFASRDALRRSYRFVDRDGELVSIRSDFSLDRVCGVAGRTNCSVPFGSVVRAARTDLPLPPLTSTLQCAFVGFS